MLSRSSLARTVLLWGLLEIIAAWQVRTADGSPVFFSWLRSVVRPIAWTAQQSADLAVDFGLGVRDLRRVIADNRTMRLELEAAHARELLLVEDVAALRESGQLTATGAGFTRDSIAARCTYRDMGAGIMEVRTETEIVLGKDTPAVTSGGLVGRVLRSEGRRHWLQLVTHAAAAVAVNTSDASVQGLVLGTGTESLKVAYVPRQAKLQRGAVLVTSGGDGIYPPGIPVAVVVRLRETDEPFLEIDATPSAELRTTRVVLLLPGWSPAIDEKALP